MEMEFLGSKVWWEERLLQIGYPREKSKSGEIGMKGLGGPWACVMKWAVNDVDMGGGCYRTRSESGQWIMKDQRDSENHLPESEPDVATGGPRQKLFLGICC